MIKTIFKNPKEYETVLIFAALDRQINNQRISRGLGPWIIQLMFVNIE